MFETALSYFGGLTPCNRLTFGGAIGTHRRRPFPLSATGSMLFDRYAIRASVLLQGKDALIEIEPSPTESPTNGTSEGICHDVACIARVAAATVVVIVGGAGILSAFLLKKYVTEVSSEEEEKLIDR